MQGDPNFNEYEPVSKHGAVLTEGLIRIWEKLGKPNDCSTEAGWRMLDQVINCWTLHFLKEVEDWKHDRELDLSNEMSLSQIVKKGGGFNPITFPPVLYQLLKVNLPSQKLNDRKFQKELIRRHDLFRTTRLHL